MQDPLISVILPVYNERKDYLIISIESILNQTLSNFELLILDDGSTLPDCINLIDAYAKKDPRIRVIRNDENIGLTKTLNKGLRMALGQFIARQDSDDISIKDRLEKQFNFMEKHPDYALCGSWSYIINEKGKNIGKKRGYSNYEDISKGILRINHFTHSTLFFRKKIADLIGGYSEDMARAQDYDFLLRLISKYPVAMIPEYFLYYRAVEKSITFSSHKLQEKYAMKARFKALREYGYPKKYYFKIIRPLLVYWLIPSKLKKQLIKLLWKI